MAELPTIRLQLEVTTPDELVRVASERLRGEFFVPWDQPFPGGRVKFEATAGAGAPGAVRGVATVRAAVRDGKKGLMARLVSLDQDSVKIPMSGLAPVVRVPTALPLKAPAPIPTPRTQRATTPAPVAGGKRPDEAKASAEASGRDDFDEAQVTRSSTLPEQVARSLKTPVPPEQAHVIRRTPPGGVPVMARPGAEPPRERTPLPAPREKTAPPVAETPRAKAAPPVVEAPVQAAPTLAPAPVRARTAPPELTIASPEMIDEAPDLVAEVAEPPLMVERPRQARHVEQAPLSMRPGQIQLAQIAGSGPMVAPRRHARRSVVIAAAVGAVVVAGIALLLLRSDDSAAGSEAPRTGVEAPRANVEERLAQADARMREGRLTGPGGDQALDHLLAARSLAPDDPRVRDRLASLADAFERLADGAIAAGDLAEAATHLQAAINAQPDRAAAVAKLRDVEQRARDRQAAPP